jgi:hypothetical protein
VSTRSSKPGGRFKGAVTCRYRSRRLTKTTVIEMLLADRELVRKNGVAPSDIMVSSFADVTKPVDMEDIPYSMSRPRRR